jgi:hypothetical protein
MRRGVSFKSRLARLALAYAIALQAVLGAWVAVASAHNVDLDASLSLCRTLASGDAQQSDEALPTHCAAMCLSGACAGGNPPSPASVATEYAPPRIATFSSDDRESVRSIAPLSALGARGPPAIV